MKKILCVVLAIVLGLLCAACGGTKTPKDPTKEVIRAVTAELELPEGEDALVVDATRRVLAYMDKWGYDVITRYAERFTGELQPFQLKDMAYVASNDWGGGKLRIAVMHFDGYVHYDGAVWESTQAGSDLETDAIYSSFETFDILKTQQMDRDHGNKAAINVFFSWIYNGRSQETNCGFYDKNTVTLLTEEQIAAVNVALQEAIAAYSATLDVQAPDVEQVIPEETEEQPVETEEVPTETEDAPVEPEETAQPVEDEADSAEVFAAVNAFLREKGEKMMQDYASATAAEPREVVLAAAGAYQLEDMEGAPVDALLFKLEGDFLWDNGIYDCVYVAVDRATGVVVSSAESDALLAAVEYQPNSVETRLALLCGAYLGWNMDRGGEGMIWSEMERYQPVDVAAFVVE